jgi:hypothetical protein
LPEKQSFFSTKGGLTVISALKKSEVDNSIITRFNSLDKNKIKESVTSFMKINQTSDFYSSIKGIEVCISTLIPLCNLQIIGDYSISIITW